MRTLVVGIPGQSRVVRHEAESVAALQAKLEIGFRVVGEVVDGVQIIPALPDGMRHYSILTSILRDNGLEMVEWLRDNGFVQKAIEAEPYAVDAPREAPTIDLKPSPPAVVDDSPPFQFPG